MFNDYLIIIILIVIMVLIKKKKSNVIKNIKPIIHTINTFDTIIRNAHQLPRSHLPRYTDLRDELTVTDRPAPAYAGNA